MRRLSLLAALALVAAPAAFASAQGNQAPPAPVVAPAASAADTSLAGEIAARRARGDARLPDAASFTFGDRTIAAGDTVKGLVAVARGNLDVYGTLDGDAIALRGDVRVHDGGHVTGDAFAAGGAVIIDGGVVDGEKRVVSGRSPAASTVPSRPLTTGESIKLTVGWFAVLAIIGIGVMIFAEPNLDGVVLALERGFARSFWTGLGGQVLLLPALLVLVVGLAITIVGVLLIPFAILAFFVAVAGLVTLGFLAVARLTGGALPSNSGAVGPRGAHLRALMIGLLIYFGVWLLAAVFTWSPVVGAILRAIAIALTWVAATLGLGATIVSRAGTVRPGAPTSAAASDDLAWQTPTPVSGVAAATRRVANSR
jgi:hypothetical protein